MDVKVVPAAPVLLIESDSGLSEPETLQPDAGTSAIGMRLRINMFLNWNKKEKLDSNVYTHC